MKNTRLATEMSYILKYWLEYTFQVAAILKFKMAAEIWTYQPASSKIPAEQDLNYMCAKIHNFIQKCTLHHIY